MIVQGVNFPEQPIADLCARYGVARLSLFGSILRDDFSPESDVDVLVEFPKDSEYSLLDLGGLMVELEALVGRRVDVRTAGFLSHYFRDRVVRSARLLYAA